MSDEFPDMSDAREYLAPAKTNLWLRILGKREDGYHEIETRMAALSLHDRVLLQWRDDDHVVLRCSDKSLPVGEDNLVVKAVRAIEEHTSKVFSLSIDLKKNIPSGAGLGGGSSDAAAVLRGINEMFALSPRERARCSRRPDRVRRSFLSLRTVVRLPGQGRDRHPGPLRRTEPADSGFPDQTRL